MDGGIRQRVRAAGDEWRERKEAGETRVRVWLVGVVPAEDCHSRNEFLDAPDILSDSCRSNTMFGASSLSRFTGTLQARQTEQDNRRVPICWRLNPERLVPAFYFLSRLSPPSPLDLLAASTASLS
jgi:hypothetical protein